MQSSLPTTIYVQNLSFLVTQIATSHNFLSIWPIYMIFMGDIDNVCNFFPPTKKRAKRVSKVKFEIFEKSQNFEKIIIFLQVYPLGTPFTLFVLFCKK